MGLSSAEVASVEVDDGGMDGGGMETAVVMESGVSVVPEGAIINGGKFAVLVWIGDEMRRGSADGYFPPRRSEDDDDPVTWSTF